MTHKIQMIDWNHVYTSFEVLFDIHWKVSQWILTSRRVGFNIKGEEMPMHIHREKKDRRVTCDTLEEYNERESRLRDEYPCGEKKQLPRPVQSAKIFIFRVVLSCLIWVDFYIIKMDGNLFSPRSLISFTKANLAQSGEWTNSNQITAMLCVVSFIWDHVIVSKGKLQCE